MKLKGEIIFAFIFALMILTTIGIINQHKDNRIIKQAEEFSLDKIEIIEKAFNVNITTNNEMQNIKYPKILQIRGEPKITWQ